MKTEVRTHHEVKVSGRFNDSALSVETGDYDDA